MLHSNDCIAKIAQQRLHSKEFKDLLVGKGGPDGSSSSPKAMEFKDLLVGKGGPDGNSR